MSDFLLTITAPLVAPLCEGDPFGVDVNHDSDYERLKSEMGKLGDIDVNAVEALSFKILAEKSKDARAMAFLAYASLRRGDWCRLADVFCALADYCTDNFERIFPRREGAKLAALRWFSEQRFSGQCGKASPSASDAPHITRLEGALSKLRAALETRFSDGAPPLSSLYKYVIGWKKAAEAAADKASLDDSEDDRKDSNINQLSSQNDHHDVCEKAMGADKSRDKVIIEMDYSEYLEIYQCIKKLEGLLKKFA